MISKNGKPFVGTHWDGYPDGLGLGSSILKAASWGKRPLTDNQILYIAAKFSLNFAEKSVLAKAEKIAIARIKKMPADQRSGYAWALKPGAHFITDIKISDEFWEWQYDLRGGKWYFRPLSGSWHQSRHSTTAFKPLTAENAEKFKGGW